MIWKVFSILLLFITFFLSTTQVVLAQTYRRPVSFEWETIPEATAYDIELTPLNSTKNSKSIVFKSVHANWSGLLTPGKYKLRIRSKDRRNVGGLWSEPSEISVNLKSIQFFYPKDMELILSNDKKIMEVPLHWSDVEGANAYEIKISTIDQKTKILETTKDTKVNLKLPIATKYYLEATALNKQNIKSDEPTKIEFTILGQKLDLPNITQPENEFVREIHWDPIENAEGYDVIIYRMEEFSKIYKAIQKFENLKLIKIPFDKRLPGGDYAVSIMAKSHLHISSDVKTIKFFVVSGNRSMVSEFFTKIRSSIQHANGWYGIASYLITQMNYTSQNLEHGSTVSYDVLGGTGRLGAGWFSEKSAWGFQSIADLSGFNNSGKTSTFSSLELSGTYRWQRGERGDLRAQFGIYYKELPEIIADPFTKAISNSMISTAGPHLGLEYWHSLSPTIGLQINGHIYLSQLSLSTPNGKSIVPSLSNQFGFMGSYRFNKKITGLAGYAYREDQIIYTAATSTFAPSGGENKTLIRGNYLNLYLEYAF